VDDVRQRHRRDQAAVGNEERHDDDRTSDAYPTWKQPVRAFFRQDGGSWKLVGFERMADKAPAGPPAPQKAAK
jgi:hypothetical protein